MRHAQMTSVATEKFKTETWLQASNNNASAPLRPLSHCRLAILLHEIPNETLKELLYHAQQLVCRTGTQEHHWHTRTPLAPPQQAAAATSQHATCMQPMRWSGSVSTTSCFSFLRTLFDSLRGECQSRHHALQNWSRQSSTQQTEHAAAHAVSCPI